MTRVADDPVTRFVEDALVSLSPTALNQQNLRQLYECRTKLIPFVGAGLSADFGYPAWHELIAGLALDAGLEAEVTPLLQGCRFEEAAEIISSIPNLFDDALRETFDAARLSRQLPPRAAVHHVPDIAQGLVMTTNLDSVLETVFTKKAAPFDHVFAGTRIREATRAVQLNQHCLLKLHGDYGDSQSRILTLSEYSREYGPPEAPTIDSSRPLPTVLEQALAAHPMLFLGCSLKTDRTIRVISQLAKRYPGVVHFALLSDAELNRSRLQQLYEWNIRPLFFPAGDFPKIESFLATVAEHWNAPAGRPLPREATEPSSASADGRTSATSATSRNGLRINGYKLFYFRNARKLGLRALANRVGVDARQLASLETVNARGPMRSAHWFQTCDRGLLAKLEQALGCPGRLEAGKPDDFLTQYMLYYRNYYGAARKGARAQPPVTSDYETRAVAFDFDGTLTARTDDETTWEKIWIKLGYTIDVCAELHDRYSRGLLSHEEWCNVTCQRFRERGFNQAHLEEIASSISLVDGVRETLTVLRDRGIGLYVLSGSIKRVIRSVLGDMVEWFEEVHANEVRFDSSGIIKEIRGTPYDFEGKARALRKIIESNRYRPYDVLFVGNSCNDIFASRSGARTLCVNPRATNPHDPQQWTDSIRRMEDLRQILKYTGLPLVNEATST